MRLEIAPDRRLNNDGKRMLRGSVARSVITPPLGMTMVGYDGRESVAQGLDSDLTATALALENNGTRVSLVRFDLAFLLEPFVGQLRDAMGVALRAPRSHILLNFSHIHCGPTVNGYSDSA